METTFCNFFGAYAKVYTLSDKVGNVFYIGCTTRPLSERLAGHISEAKNAVAPSRKNAKIRDLDYNINATVVDIKWVTGRKPIDALRNMSTVEKNWILKFRELGYDLCNHFPVKKQTKKVVIEPIGFSISAQI